jgi:hypothetical protein
METIQELETELVDLLCDLKSVYTFTQEEKEVIKTKIHFLSSALQQLKLLRQI